MMRSIWIAALLVCASLAFLAGARAGDTAKGWIGVQAETVTDRLAEERSLAMEYGALVTVVDDGGPAAEAGLQKGDLVYSMSGQEIRSAEALSAAIGKLTPGVKAKLSVARGQRFLKLELMAAAQPEPVVAAGAVGAQGEPLLRLDPGGHMAVINAVAFTPDGSQLVSASDDKTIRVWDIASGKTVRVIRGEAGAGLVGKVFAIALSPDGKWLAAGGCMDKSSASESSCGDIRLYDFASGKLVALLNGHEDVVSGLAFSPDGRRLISGSHDKTAIVWDVATGKAWRLLGGHRDYIYAVGFTPDGARAVTGSFDHELRLWSAEDGALLKAMTGHGDMVSRLAVAPDGRIASGDVSGEIRLWDGRTGAFLKTFARQKTLVGALSFSPDGKTLLSTCGGGNISCATVPQRVYDAASGREITTYREHDNIVSAAAISPDGRWAATGGFYGEIHIWDLRTGARRQGSDGRPLTLGGTGRPVWAVGFSADGRQIAWGSEPITEIKQATMLQRALKLPSGQAAPSDPRALDPEAAKSFRRAETRHGEWSLSHRKGGNYGKDSAILDIKQGGTVLASVERDSTNGFQHRAYGFTPDGGTVISGGSSGVLAAYGLNGEKLGEFVGHESDVWAVAPSPDGRYLVSGAADQTARLWNLKTRELLVTLFQGSDGEWVMWTPQGFYEASREGGKLIAWQLNKGPPPPGARRPRHRTGQRRTGRQGKRRARPPLGGLRPGHPSRRFTAPGEPGADRAHGSLRAQRLAPDRRRHLRRRQQGGGPGSDAAAALVEGGLPPQDLRHPAGPWPEQDHHRRPQQDRRQPGPHP
jgi:WD40 repeat protein